MYEPLKVVKCEKCGKVIAKPKELARITKKKKTSGFQNGYFV